MNQINTIMLVDDNKADNLFHKIVIKKAGFAGDLIVYQYAEDALAYLESEPKEPVDLILLDINMPRMNGFEFLEEYCQLDEERRAKGIVVMLTTSLNPDDEKRAKTIEDVKGFMNKPLTKESFQEIVATYFLE